MKTVRTPFSDWCQGEQSDSHLRLVTMQLIRLLSSTGVDDYNLTPLTGANENDLIPFSDWR